MSDYGALLDLDERTDRAKDVIDGFKCPTDRLAHDVMLLARIVRNQDAEITRLKRLVLASDLKKAAGTQSGVVEDLMGMFGMKK